MLVGTNDGGIDVMGRPVALTRGISGGLDRSQAAIPEASVLPAVEPGGGGGGWTVAGGQIGPGRTGAQNPQNAVDNGTIVMPGRPPLLPFGGRRGGSKRSIRSHWVSVRSPLCLTVVYRRVCVYALGVANLYPLVLGLVVGVVPEQADLASARCALAAGITILLAPLALAALADHVGIRNAYAVVLPLLLAALLISQRAQRLVAHPPAPTCGPS